MLSKQDKLKYGQMLRLQMKQKQQRKKLQELQKRGGIKKSPTDTHLLVQKQNNTNDKKQYLQRRLETQQYIPFGRPGGGAPSLKPTQRNPPIYSNVTDPNYQKYPPQQNHQGTPVQQYRYHPDSNNKQHNPYFQNKYYPIENNIQGIPPQQTHQNYPYQGQQYGGYQPSFTNNPQNFTGNYNYNQGFNPNQGYENQNNIYPPQRHLQSQMIDQKHADQQQQAKYYYEQNQSIKQNQVKKNQQLNQERQKTLENQQMMQIYKKGGRNLLKLENQTIEQISVKQKQKIQMQRYLKLQIQQAERKKQEEKRKNKQMELLEDKKNLQYIEKQKQKIIQDQRKQMEKRQKLQQDNLKNLQIKKKMEEQAKNKKNPKSQRNLNKNQEILKIPPQQQHIQLYQKSQQVTESQDQPSSVYIRNTYQTDMMKQLKKQTRDSFPQRKMEQFTGQLQKMKEEIANQGHMFQKQIMKVKMEAQRALIEKKKADQQIMKLKYQLKKKMEEDNDKLFQALQRNGKQVYDQLPNQKKKGLRNQIQVYQSKQPAKKPLKPKPEENLVTKRYQQPNVDYSQNLDSNGLKSLVGDSKKIPINLPNHNQKLTMSQLSQLARQTGFFNPKNSPDNKKGKNKQYLQQSIVQQDEDRGYSRNSQRQNNNRKNVEMNQKDQLDRLIQSRKKSRGGWEEMSSVNSEITKQIQQLLKKKGNSNERPNSKLSNAGKQILNNNHHGIIYQGGSLNTFNSGGTLDVDRINNRNQDRLRQLRNLGVQTINTQDEDLNRLDILLKKYNN